MNRFKLMAMATLAAGAFALAACGGANNSPAAGGNAANAPANTPADNSSAKGNGGEDKPDENPEPTEFDTAKEREAVIDEAWGYLKGMYQKDDSTMDENAIGIPGGWGPKSMNIPYTAMVLQSVLGTKHWKPDQDIFSESVNFLAESQEQNGSWSYAPSNVMPEAKGQRAVYITSIVVELFSKLNGVDSPWKGKLDDAIAKGREYIVQSQVGNADGPAPDYDPNKVGFGGWAYSKEEIDHAVGEKGKPASNMSTTTYAIDALHACGVEPGDKIFKDALTFLKRNQNAGEVQDEGFEAMYKDKKIKMADKGDPNYGGSIYSEETSKSGVRENEDGTVTLLSYGTMTYNLLRDYLFAGLKKDDLPVKLAWRWIQRNYTVSHVPGYEDSKDYEQGLYYYYVSMAKTLNALGVDHVEEPDRGLKHDWRADLVKELQKRQKGDGSWVNSTSRWQEDSPTLCTCYALIALRNTEE
ncbi:MAG: terpene cyclase/mutase family protein [Planctomycetes bacterium]|nr:terpene cyclase/mutase family protein [Planctomycetota bacterium]